jgi:hypothetical protein
MSATKPEPVVDAEIIGPLSKPQAKALDKRIRAASDKVGTNVNALLNLLDEAAYGQIHRALGVTSWTAWFRDAVQLERKSLMSLMSGRGMSRKSSEPAVLGEGEAGDL